MEDQNSNFGDEASKPKVIVADMHEMVRESISFRITKGCNVSVVEECDHGYATLKAIRQHSPDLLIMDLDLVRPSGSEVLNKAHKIAPDMKIIVVTSQPTISNAFYSLSRGAAAFLPKQVSSTDFVHAVHATLAGFSYLPKDLMSQFVHSRRNLSRVGNVFGLSLRELEVMQACAQGMSTKEVADDLKISVRTVETHRYNIYRKTDTSSQEELRNIAECI